MSKHVHVITKAIVMLLDLGIRCLRFISKCNPVNVATLDVDLLLHKLCDERARRFKSELF